jgi:hypothetical protein
VAALIFPFSVATRGIGQGLITALAGGLLNAGLCAQAGATAARSASWAIDANIVTPRRAVRRAALAELIAWIGRAGTSTVFYYAIGFPLLIGAPVGLLISFILFLATESGMAVFRHYIGLLTASAHGLLPWRAGRFLDWAAAIGLLRVSGTAYQFRHRELFEWLVQEPDSDPRERPAGALAPPVAASTHPGPS